MRLNCLVIALLVISALSPHSALGKNNGTAETGNKPPTPRCGYVYDGDKLTHDLDFQVSKSTVQANWFGFETSTIVILRYEWAIVSKKLVTDEFFVEAKNRCRGLFVGEPDVMDWKSVGVATAATATNLKLVTGETYYVLVRAYNMFGSVILTNSDGVKIVEPDTTSTSTSTSSTSTSTATPSLETVTAQGSLPEGSVTADEMGVPPQLEFSALAEDSTITKKAVQEATAISDLCTANYCRRKVPVGAFLTELYGPPIYTRDPSLDPNVDILFGFLSSDRGGGLGGGAIAGIVIGCVVFLCLILFPLYFSKGDGASNKFQINTNRTENVENI